MSKIKGKNTKPELLVRKYLFSHGLRYKLHDKNLPGKPDLVFPKYNCVVFIHGCFWHGHEGCRYFVVPKTRMKWWSDKINGNKAKDDQNFQKLIEESWKVIVIWECDLKSDKQEKTLENLLREITGQ